MKAMSRRKKKENPIGLLIIWVLGLLLIIFTVLASLIIWLGWATCEVLYGNHPRTPEEADILLDRDERQEVANADRHIREVEARLAQIEIEGQHLRRRKDGLFHAGSNLGAQLNAEIDELVRDLNDSQAIRHELLARPGERLRNWAAPLSRLITFRWAIVVYLVCILYATLAKPASVVHMNQMILDWLNAYLPPLSIPIYGGMALASIVASCVAGATYLLYSRLIHGHYARQLPGS